MNMKDELNCSLNSGGVAYLLQSVAIHFNVIVQNSAVICNLRGELLEFVIFALDRRIAYSKFRDKQRNSETSNEIIQNKLKITENRTIEREGANATYGGFSAS